MENKPIWEWIEDINLDDINFDIPNGELPEPKTIEKYPSIASVKDNSWRNLLRNLWGEMNPKTLYHNSSGIFDKFNLDHVGYHGQNSGRGAYLSNNPERARNYGKFANKFFLNSNAKLIPEHEALQMLDYTEHPWFTKDGTLSNKIAKDRFNKYLSQKGYIGYKNNMGWETPTYDYVIFNENSLKPANTSLQRFINRIPTQTLGEMASKLYNTPGVAPTLKFFNRAAIPLAIYEGLSQPTASAEAEQDAYNNWAAQHGQPLQAGISY